MSALVISDDQDEKVIVAKVREDGGVSLLAQSGYVDLTKPELQRLVDFLLGAKPTTPAKVQARLGQLAMFPVKP